MKAQILAILGPSGVGKSSTRAQLQRLDPRFTVISAWTTRPPRSSDIDRVHVTEDEFDRAYSEETFLPVNGVYGARYATPKAPIWAALDRGDFPLIDWPVDLLPDLQRTFRQRVVSVYLKPPSAAELRRRLLLDRRDADGERLRRGLRELAELPGRSLPEIVDAVVIARCGHQRLVADEIYRVFISKAAGIDLDQSRLTAAADSNVVV